MPESTTPTLRDRIERGEFNATTARPLPPRRDGRPLSPYTYREVSGPGRTALDEYNAGLTAHLNSKANGLARFWSAVYAEFGLAEDDPFAEIMREMAWEAGHSNGYAEVLLEFEDFMPLYRLYRAAKDGRG